MPWPVAKKKVVWQLDYQSSSLLDLPGIVWYNKNAVQMLCKCAPLPQAVPLFLRPAVMLPSAAKH
jgi:hypothetical protein